MRILIFIFSAILLSGCAGAVPWNKQNFAGITSWDFKYCKIDGAETTGATTRDGEDVRICGVEVIDGKERGSVQLDFQLPDGTVMNYLANDEAAFEGQAIRAEVERAVSQAVADTLPGIVETVLKAVVPVPND